MVYRIHLTTPDLRSNFTLNSLQGNSNPHYVDRTTNILMLRGELLLSSGSAALAVKIYTELLNLFPGLVVAHEQRAQCHYILVKEHCITFLLMARFYFFTYPSWQVGIGFLTVTTMK